MTRKDILKKHGFSWTSNVNLKEELSEQAVPEFLTKRMNLPVRREEEKKRRRNGMEETDVQQIHERSRQMTRKVSCLHLVYGNIRESDLQI